MAAGASSTISPPPGSAPPSAPTSPPAASPAPAQPNPQLEGASRQVIQIVSGLRSIAKAFPATSEPISKINDLIREVQMKIMAQSQPGEGAAPPTPAG